MARYGQTFKERAVAKLLPPESSSVEIGKVVPWSQQPRRHRANRVDGNRARLASSHDLTNRLAGVTGRQGWLLHCDLHSRWKADGVAACIDSIHEGTRQMYRVDTTSIINKQGKAL